MEIFKSILAAYSTVLGFLPENLRLGVAIFVLLVLMVLFWRFIQKSIIWLILFFLLLPAGWPALCEVGLSIWEKIIVPIVR
ncbi:MAG TPA: hypothetical protein PLC05_02230 [bacterium]|nr:hypothetical protein [bacterium]HOR57472.1 hypothetical protein [bacterium]HPL56300.1 hypothetical protein [bacterium]